MDSSGDNSKETNGADPHGLPTAPVAVVLAGAGARGAYEAGFIATLLPHLQPRPTIFVGTSAGAINAALLASVADRSPEAARDEIIRRWSTISNKIVLDPIWRSVSVAIAKYAGALLLGTEPPTSFLSTAPLSQSLANPALIDWHAINDNISKGHVQVLAVAATEAGSGRTKVFYQASSDGSLAHDGKALTRAQTASTAPFVQPDEKQAIDYVLTELTSEHVRASAAIPVFFPPVAIETASHTSFFLDGGVRLNAPLKPALQFGAKGVVVISTDPRRFGTSDAVDASRPPSMQDQVLQIMRGTFGDRMVEDIRVLLDRNQAARSAAKLASGGDATSGADQEIPVIFGGPLDQDRVGSVAARAIKQILRGPKLLGLFKNLDLAILDWFTSVSATSGPDILSYLLFEPEFIDAAVRAGIQDAEALLNDYPEPVTLWTALRERERRRAKVLPKPKKRPGAISQSAPGSV
jgi:NTE family protein